MQALLDALLFRSGHNTTLVVMGTILLGIAGGFAGALALLRKRSLFADALGHATLPGICIAFLLAPLFGVAGRSLPVMLVGATIAAVVATGLVQLILRATRLHEDAAIGVTLSVLFGLGIVLLSVIQTLPSGDQGGLKSFLFGQTAAMQRGDAILLAGIALIAASTAWVLLKEFAIVAFDEGFARSIGVRAGLIDTLQLLLVVAVTVAGLQAVGLVLVIAILVIPPVAARLWTDRVRRFVPLAALIGAVSGWVGASLSSIAPRQPAGALIVLTSTAIFLASLFVAPRGILPAAIRRTGLIGRIAIDHLLKTLLDGSVDAPTLSRSCGLPRLVTDLLLRWLAWRNFVRFANGRWEHTAKGAARGAAIARNHALWTAYLVRDAAIAPDHVDPSAEAIEHVLDPALVAELERTLARRIASDGDSP
ncbi:MAG: metal ABC transporter permease [Phycisphaerae bacterium]|jgi:manganese/zinc/iron transport system permease protein|nr:metal ABC transporter permease [Phycisphaerae bacterium]